MSDNDIVSDGVEAIGVRTFAADEMAANIMCLMGGELNNECQTVPLLVDIGGGLGQVDDFKEKLSAIRRNLDELAATRKAIEAERLLDLACVDGPNALTTTPLTRDVPVKANLQLPVPTLPDYDKEIAPLATSLEGMVDLSRVVVITGFLIPPFALAAFIRAERRARQPLMPLGYFARRNFTFP